MLTTPAKASEPCTAETASVRHLDPLDQGRVDREEIEAAAAAVGRVVEPDPVEQHQGEIGLAAADRKEASPAGAAGREGAHAGDLVQRLEQGGGLHPLDLVRLDDAESPGECRFGARGGDDDDVGRQRRGGRGRHRQQICGIEQRKVPHAPRNPTLAARERPRQSSFASVSVS